MFVNLYVLVLLHINALFEIEGRGLSHSTCSRIIATSTGKTEPMIFSVSRPQYILLYGQSKLFPVTIESPDCKVHDTVVGNPCKNESDYLNITIDDVTKYDRLHVDDKRGICIANFVPKCIFKPVKPGNVIPQVSFPFVRFANGGSSVEIQFSINGSESNVQSELRVGDTTVCEWTGMTANSSFDKKYCKDLTKNQADDRLDFTLVYELDIRIEGPEPGERTNFEFFTEESVIGVTVYWNETGESPDIAECRKHGNPLTTTSSGRSIGLSFTVLLGVTIWSFKQ
nr:diagnostic antigen gp50 [Hymenolepis microstoma]